MNKKYLFMRYSYFVTCILGTIIITAFTFDISKKDSKPLSHLHLKGLNYELAEDSPPVNSLKKTSVPYYYFTKYVGENDFDVKEQISRFLKDTVSLISTYSYENFFNDKGAISQRVSYTPGGQHVKY